MNLSDEDNTTFQPFDVNVTTDQPQYDYDNVMSVVKLRVVIVYICIVLGIPGNIISAIIWLRRHVASKNSSAVYLSALAINDLVFLIAYLSPDWLHMNYYSISYNIMSALFRITSNLEPLFVLGFSVERLIAISCPLQVRLCNYI